MPRRAQLSEYEHTGKVSDWLEVEVIHRAEKPAGEQRIAQMKQQYGSTATSLLELYAAHNGADLFVVEGNAGFVLLPNSGNMLLSFLRFPEMRTSARIAD